MKNAVLAILVGAFLVLGSMQPAQAWRTVVVQNHTKTLAHVDIIYHGAVCKDDRFALGAGAVRSIYSGVCLIKSFTAWIEDSAGQGHACRPNYVSGTEYRIVVNKNPARGYCTVQTQF